MPGAAERDDRFGGALRIADFGGNGRATWPSARRARVSAARPARGSCTSSPGRRTASRPQEGRAGTRTRRGCPERPSANDAFGAALGSGDLNGDGRGDLAVGVPGEAVGRATGAGALTILPGAPGGVTASGSRTINQGSGLSGAAERGDEAGASAGGGTR